MAKIKWVIMLFVLVFLLFHPKSTSVIYAKDANELEVIFVIDTSNSMNATDQNRMSTEVINLFIDLYENSETNVGFVFYNDKIVDSQSPLLLKDIEDKSILKNRLKSIQRSGYTDTGLALKKGQELFQNNSNHSTKRAIILLTDGEIDLPNQSKRTKNDSENDLIAATEKAKQEKYPIYTVGLNSGGNINHSQLEQIAMETGGSYFNAKNAEALLEIFQLIFTNLDSFTHYPITSLEAKETVQQVNIDIPTGITEGTIVLLSKNPVEHAELDGLATVGEKHQSSHYTILNVKQISESPIRLNFKGKLGDNVSISFLSNQTVLATLEMPEGELIENKPILIRSTLLNNGNPIELATDIEGELIVKHLENGTEMRFPMKNNGTSFEFEEAISFPGKYEAKVLVKGDGFQVETEPKTFELKPSQPLMLKSESITIEKWDENTVINLNEYISNPSTEQLTFGIDHISDENKVKATIQDNILTLTPIEKGETTVHIQITDPSGERMISSFHISVESNWYTSFIMTGIAIILICIGLIMIWFIRNNHSLIGRFEAVFLQTESNTPSTRKHWPLSAFRNRKKLTLFELFSRLDIEEELPGAKQIFFSATKNGLTMHHDSKCIIMKGGFIVPRKQKILITNNEKLRITFENGKSEVELLYKATEQHEIMRSYSYSS